MIETLILAAAIGGCPLPGALAPPHKHHKHKVVPETSCSCLEAYPRTIVLPAPEPDIEPIELGIYRYYTVISFNDPAYSESFDTWETGFYGAWGWNDGIGTPAQPVQVWHSSHVPGGRRYVGGPTPREAPEIDPSGATSGLTLLAGALAVARGRRRV